jgi:ribosomal-protein-alanine N-acetyltransferase
LYLVTENLIIRDFNKSDAKDFYEVAKNPNVGPNCNWDVHRDLNHTKYVIKHFMKEKDTFAIVLKSNNKVIGDIQMFKDKTREDTYEIGYCIHPMYWNNNYATEACQKIIKYYFEFVNCYTVVALTKEGNLASQRVLEKLGFIKEGILYNYRKDIYARYMNCVSYSLSKR